MKHGGNEQQKCGGAEVRERGKGLKSRIVEETE